MDEAVAKRLIQHANAIPASIYGRRGKAHLRSRIGGYNFAAHYAPWLVLVDLHSDQCAPALRAEWLPNPSPLMCLRVAVRAVEAWLLADRQRLARFLSVSVSRVPANPEELLDPKAVVVALANTSRRTDIRRDMVPRPGSGRSEGPAYTSRLIEFVKDWPTGWDPDAAAALAPSLARCLTSLRELAANVA